MRREEKCEKSSQPGVSESCSGGGSSIGDVHNNKENSAPPTKRRKEDDDLEDLYQKECEEEIFKDQLAREVENKPKISRVKELMDATHSTRRVWIEGNAPSVSEVLEEYPCLKHGKVVSY